MTLRFLIKNYLKDSVFSVFYIEKLHFGMRDNLLKLIILELALAISGNDECLQQEGSLGFIVIRLLRFIILE
jgi:hypothetical protein